MPACGTSKIGDAYRGKSLALIIVEDWELPAKDPATTFSKTVKKDAKIIGEGVEVVSKVTGCVAGVVVLGVLVANDKAGSGDPRGAVVVFCALGGGVGYLTGYGIGALVGTVHGAIAVVQNEFTNADTGFKVSGPSAELAEALQ